MSLDRGQRITTPFTAEVFEAVYGSPVTVEYRMKPENESSFFDDTLSIEVHLKDDGKVAQFLLLHPWFSQHVVFVWKIKQITHNILITKFNMVTFEPGVVIVCGIGVRPIDNLTACQAIEDARITIEAYNGTNASEIRKEYESKDYFKSGLLPRLDI